jgi:hypothetical protein
MKSESVSTALVLVLFLSALFAVWLSVRWFFSVKEMQEMQFQQTRINNTRAAAQALANDVVQYARGNPRMEPLLNEFNLRPMTNQVQPNPGGK